MEDNSIYISNEKTYTIILNNGMRIEDLKINGDNYISKIEVDPSILEGTLRNVVINDGERDEIHNYMELIHLTKTDDEWWFALRDIKPNDIVNMKLRSDIEYLAMMMDIEI